MSTTSSRLDELRKYRFQNVKKMAPNDGHNGETATTNGAVDEIAATKMKVAMGRKRIRVISHSDSSGDEDGVGRQASKIAKDIQNGSPAKLTVSQREQRLVELKTQFPSVDATVLQDELARTDWDVAKAVERMKQNKPNQINAVQNGHHVSHASHTSHTMPMHKVNRASTHIFPI